MEYSPRTSPLGHQLKAIDALSARPSRPCNSDVFAWLMEMGTGKTKVVLDEFGRREAAGDLDCLLVLAPAGSYRNWYEDRADDFPGEFRKHLSPDLMKRLLFAPWVSGAGAKMRARLDNLVKARGRPRALIVNVESLSTATGARDTCEAFLKSGRALMVVDESTTIKSPTAARTRSVARLGEFAVARRIMSGLPTPRSPLDLYCQFEFLDWRILGLKSYYAFRARYAITQRVEFGGRKVDIVVGYRNVRELQEKIAPYSYRVLKEDCLDLPPKVYQIREVNLSKEQIRIYRELKEFATAQIEEGGGSDFVTATSVITQIMRLQQLVSGHVVDDDGIIHDVPSGRLDQLMQVLDEIGGKAIIWVTFDHTLRKIVAALKKEYGDRSVAAYWGGNRSSRAEDEARFLGDPECRFMVSTPAAGGRGNNWTVANLVVYYANTYDLELRSQSEDRAHRAGLDHKVTYVDLVARGTVDEKILKALRAKIDLAATITGENYREWLV